MTTAHVTDEEIFEYHSGRRAGKLAVQATKPLLSQRDFSLAYTPGVGRVVEAVDADPSAAYEYTAKGNLVAVVSNGTAILGLGDRGALASKPVMEGKAVLFKQLADVDVFDIELEAATADEIVAAVKAIAPGFGGINLEDINAPLCFEVEERLRQELQIPVFHDDQHGTAIITGAALLNAASLTDRVLGELTIVVVGAGAAGIACARMFISMGIRRENITLFDSVGMIYEGRTARVNAYKGEFAQPGPGLSLTEALRGADVLLGVSGANVIAPEMLVGMAPRPILLLQANPDPEISYELATATRPDAIVATGRSDYPNQVNNVLGFPFIFRGALDAQATTINEEMKRAATHALAALAREPVPATVLQAYGLEELRFGPNYIIPKPNDYRVLEWEAAAVAEAAIRSGVARKTLDLDEYRERLRGMAQPGRPVIHSIIEKARQNPGRVVFPEGEHPSVLRAARLLEREGFGTALLMGRTEVIRNEITKLGLGYEPEILDTADTAESSAAAEEIYQLRQRRGVTREEARHLAVDPLARALMMVQSGKVDAVLAGLSQESPATLRPTLQLVPLRPGLTTAAGVYIVIKNGQLYFFADAVVNIDPDAHALAEIALMTADFARDFEVEPTVAMISYSNFGSSDHPVAEKMRRAADIVHERRPDLVCDGEMQIDVALRPELSREFYPFSRVHGANVLIFPNVDAAEAALQAAEHLGDAYSLGPVLLGPRYSVHVLQPHTDARSISLMAAMAIVEARVRSAAAAQQSSVSEPAHDGVLAVS
jgi:malate dehydrogenase (oxaloacetate-decarboxylating)(NADP+)